MERQIADLTPSQWDFLAVLEAFGEPCSVDVLYEVAPLSPGELLDLIRLAREGGWISQGQDNAFVIHSQCPEPVIRKLRKMNTAGRISALHRKIVDTGLAGRLSTKVVSNLLDRSGREYEAALMEYELARKAMEHTNPEAAAEHLERTLGSLKRGLGDREFDMLFVQACLALSNLRRRTKKGLSEIPRLLDQAMAAAERQGDRRARALVSLHIGRNFVFLDRRDRALPILEAGLEEVRELGDKDISAQSAEFIGTFFFIQGLYRDAVIHYDAALHTETTDSMLLPNLNLPLLLGYSAFLTGQYSRAIGVLDSHWRRALMDKDAVFATTYRTSLGLLLLMMGYRSQAVQHLREALEEAREQDNHWSLYEAEGALAYYHFTEGRISEAYDTAVKVWSKSAAPDPFSRRPIWAHGRDMFYEFHRQGYPPVPGYNFLEEMESILSGVNVHLKGVVRRIKARMAVEENKDLDEAEALLEQSAADLARAGDPIYLAKARIDHSRVRFRRGDRDGARKLALQAWELLSGYPREAFPDDLGSLLNITPAASVSGKKKDILKRFMTMLEEFYPCTNMEEYYLHSIASVSRFFEAERGGLFLFEGETPRLEAGYNLTAAEVQAESFRSNLEQVIRTCREGKPLAVRPGEASPGDVPAGGVSSILCLPFERRQSGLKGVLYFDSTYENTDFMSLDAHRLRRIAEYLGTSADRFDDYFRIADRGGASLESGSGTREGYGEELGEEWEIRGQSPAMVELMGRARQVAESEASVLILGETGVGKELLARNIHAMSARGGGPFVEVDLGSIPETLVESELFGHEKGAFTGADRQKKGRLELAHKGTLFIDEVGDIPKGIQIKLLRTLQERSFVRVGGTRKLVSDFRLVAATNRDLEKAVEEGYFREDLYYRLNVVPLTVPALKERGRDVLVLAQHFLDYYGRKYKKGALAFTEEQKAELRGYSWPGNVRELRNVIERAVILSGGGVPELSLPVGVRAAQAEGFPDEPTLEELQRRYIRHVLEKTEGRISGPGGAAEILGLKRTTLYSRMRKLGMA